MRDFFKQKTAYEIGVRLVGSEMCIRDRLKNENYRTGTKADDAHGERRDDSFVNLSLIHI